MAENVDFRSLHTEDDYSIISRPQQGSAYPNFLPFDQDSVGHDMPSDTSSSPLRDGCATESEHLSYSHHALERAYEHLKGLYSELQLDNRKLRKTLRSTSSSESLKSMEQKASIQMMSTNHENEVTRAWDAYSDKCRECEKLRDDLRASEQRSLKTQSMMRDQARKEDTMRTQAQLDQYKKQIQQLELEIRDHKNKEEMAREELQKEKEYHETVLDVAKQRHEEMENKIQAQTLSLQEKIRQCQELEKSLESQRQVAKTMTEKREVQFNEKLCEKEDEVMNQKEERALLEAHVAKLEQWKQNVENFHQASGLPHDIPVLQTREEDIEMERISGEFDLTELAIGLSSLTDEINSLKQQTSMQCAVLARMYEDPNVRDSIHSMNLNGLHFQEGRYKSMPVQCSEPVPSSYTPSTFSSLDQRLLVESSPQSSDEFQSRQTREIMSNMQRFVVSRQAQMSGTIPRNTFETRPQGNGLPSGSAVNANISFSNAHTTQSASEVLHSSPLSESEDDENATSYYSAVTEFEAENSQSGHPSRQSVLRMRRHSGSSDSDTCSSNNTTLIDPGAAATNSAYADNATSSEVNRATVQRNLPTGPQPIMSDSSLNSQLESFSNQMFEMQRSQVVRSLPEVTPGHGRAFLTQINPERVCPVCETYFSSETTESFMQRHINGHFSEQEDEVA